MVRSRDLGDEGGGALEEFKRVRVVRKRDQDRSRRVLNVGAGGAPVHKAFRKAEWREVRVDLDEGAEPDVVGSIVDLPSLFPSERFDAVWCSHCLEHLYDHELAAALGGFRAVLQEDGFALIACPDLMAVAELLAAGKLEETAYVSPAGPVRALDMLFGFSPAIAAGNQFMAHRTGFTVDRLGRLLLEAGFREVRVATRTKFELWAVALMPKADEGLVRGWLRSTPQKFLVAEV